MQEKAKQNMVTPAAETPQNHPESLLAAYEKRIKERGLHDDDAQRTVLSTLEILRQQLGQPDKPEPSLIKKLLGKDKQEAKQTGIYIWGNVGRGKSMLMDLFFDNTPLSAKRRVHFHAFMQEVHSRIHQLRKSREHSQSGADPVIILGRQIAAETRLLCFDELQATDVADATLLFRLFNTLFEQGVVIVSTSNHPPASLYTGGIQKERFNQFITLIEEHTQVVSLSSPHDYRHMQVRGIEQRYFHPLGTPANQFIESAIQRLCTNQRSTKETLSVHGRDINFACYDGSVGRFTFKELCENPLGAADYLAIAQRCDTIILTDIPKLTPEKRNEAKRFVTLIDALYEHKVDLLCTAAAAPEALYAEGDGAFEFKRTVSRLAEMQSKNWGN
ncbi:MAG: cell division protein ZapE [Alphaproteobacteria bacterium]